MKKFNNKNSHLLGLNLIIEYDATNIEKVLYAYQCELTVTLRIRKSWGV